MFTFRRQQLIPALVAPAAARPSTVYQAAAENVLAATVGEIAPPPKPHARSFRDRVHSPFGRLLARLLIKLLVLTPLPREAWVLSIVNPASMLWAFVEEGQSLGCIEVVKGGTAAVIPPTLLVSGWPGGVCTERNQECKGQTNILVINTTSGFVASFNATDTGVSFSFPASINDTLMITVTFPDGNTTTFKKSQYQGAGGKTAVGPGGGVVKSADGSVQLRIPEGALPKGIVFEIAGLTLADLETQFPGQQPSLENETGTTLAYLGGGLRIEASEAVQLKKEADLVLAIPDYTKAPEAQRPATPQDAFYYVYKRVEIPCTTITDPDCPASGKRISFETIDHAFVEKVDGQDKVVTASYPFLGFVAASLATHLFLTWSLGKVATMGVVSGKVLQATPKADGSIDHLPVEAGATVRALDSAGKPLLDRVATTGTDGAFSFWDPRSPELVGGQLTIEAVTKDGRRQTAVTYQPTQPPHINLEHYGQRQFTANVIFPAQAPAPPPPAVDVKVMRVGANGKRADVRGFVAAGEPLIIGMKLKTPGGKVGIPVVKYGTATQDLTLKADAAGADEPLRMDQIADFTAPFASSYSVTVNAIDAFLREEPTTVTFVAVAGGGVDNKANLPNDPPRVIEARTVPKVDAGGVPVTSFVTVMFTEPVRNVIKGDNVKLIRTSDGSEVPIFLSAMSIDPNNEPVQIGEHTNPAVAVTSLTIRPQAGLEYGTKYAVRIGSTTNPITDTDTDDPDDPNDDSDPKELEPVVYTSAFSTFAPEALNPPTADDQNTTASPALVVLEDRAYLIKLAAAGTTFQSTLETYRIDDPVAPERLFSSPTVTGLAIDAAGMIEDAGRHKLAVVTGPPGDRPTNLHVVEASTGTAPRWLGLASLTAGATQGFVTALTIHNGTAYAATTRMGIQAVDLSAIASDWEGLGDHTTAWWQATRDSNTAGKGYQGNGGTLVSTMPVKDGYTLRDIAAASYTSGTRVVVAGWDRLWGDNPLPLIVADPLSPNATKPITVDVPATDSRPAVKIQQGWHVALGNLDGVPVAVLAGTGQLASTGAHILAAFSMTDPDNPLLLAAANISDYGGVGSDLVLKDGKAYIGLADRTAIYSLANVLNGGAPEYLGPVMNVGGHVHVADNEILVGTAYPSSRFGSADPTGLNGVRTAALEEMAYIPRPRPAFSKPVVASQSQPGQSPQEEETLSDIPVTLRVIPANPDVKEAMLQLYTGAAVLGNPIKVAMSAGQGVYTIAKGLKKRADDVITGVMSYFSENAGETLEAERKIDIGTVTLNVDSNNDTFVNEDDEAKVRSDPEATFTFWEADPSLIKTDRLLDWATLHVKLPFDLATGQQLLLTLPDTAWELKKKEPSTAVCAAPVPTPTPAPVTGRRASPDSRAYLCDATQASNQSKGIDSDDSTQPQKHPVGWVLTADQARAGVNEFVFRVSSRTSNLRGTTEKLGITLLQGTERTPLAQRNVLVEPFKWLTNMVSLRQSISPQNPTDPFDPYFRIRSDVEFVPGWGNPFVGTPHVPATAGVITVIVHGFAVNYREFAEGIPSDDPDRYNPSEFQLKAKRLYWAGHPILQAQDNAFIVGVSWPGDIAGEVNPVLIKAAGTDNVRPYFPEDEFNAFLGSVPLSRFLADIRIGPPDRKINIFAHSLGNMLVGNALQRLTSDTASWNTTLAAPINYVMNEAAVATEAYLDNYNPLPLPNQAPGVPILLSHAQALGFARRDPNDPTGQRGIDPDKRWVVLRNEVLDRRSAPFNCPTDPAAALPDVPSYCANTPDSPECQPDRCDIVRRFFTGSAQLNPGFSETFDFTRRWSAFMDDGGVPRTPWGRLFVGVTNASAENNRLKLFNTYNREDVATRIDRGPREGFPGINSRAYAWAFGQVYGKPFGELPDSSPGGYAQSLSLLTNVLLKRGRADDGEKQQKWWTLEINDRASPWQTTAAAAIDQDALWDDGQSHVQEVRRWAELALWYPALSPAAGASPISALNNQPLGNVVLPDQVFATGRNIDLTEIGGNVGPTPIGTLSHSYMTMKSFPEVWKAYRVFSQIFRQ